MNKKLISHALSNVEDAYILEALSTPAAKKDRTPERTNNMNRYEAKHKRHSRQVFRLALAACMFFALAVTAFAVHYYLGIRDMENNIPDEADPYIQQHTEVAAQEDWSARIAESLCDENRILITVTVSGGDKYILAPTDADPDTLVKNIGIEGEQTLHEYAQEQGKELLFVGATLKENDALGGIGSQTFRNTSPSEMTILIQTNKTDALTEKEIICHVYAVDANWEKQTLDIPFSLEEAPSDDSVYVPDDPAAVSGMTIGEATIAETPLGLSIRFVASVEGQEILDDIKKVEFDGIVRGEGGWVLEDDGNWWYTLSRCSGEVGETLVARYYNWDDEEIAVITFRK